MRSKGSGEALFFSEKRSAFAAALFNEPDLADGHLAIDGFAHVVNRQPGGRYRGHGFHLNTGFSADAHAGFDFHARWILCERQINFNRSDVERMAHRNELGSLFCRHDAGHAGH